MCTENIARELDDVDAMNSSPVEKFMQTCFYCPLPEVPVRGAFAQILRWFGGRRYIYWRIWVTEYADMLKEHYEAHNSQGYDVIQVVPIQMASRDGGIFGLRRIAITRGAVLIGRRRDAGGVECAPAPHRSRGWRSGASACNGHAH
jgi:hypothetical protein